MSGAAVTALLAWALGARVVAPEPKARVTKATVRLYAEVRKGAALTLTVDGAPAGRCRTEGLAHCTVSLTPGVHAVALDDGEGAAAWVLHRLGTEERLPLDGELGYTRPPLHTPRVEQACAPCHAMTEGDGKPKDTSLLKTTCSVCHAAVLEKRWQHGPVGQGACLECHDPQGQPRYAVGWPAQEVCFRCHLDILGAMNRKAFRHGPAAQGHCTTCHDPHGSDNRFWLRRVPFDVCTNCHVEKKAERHVVVGFAFGDSHPKKGRDHPLKPGTEFACPSCHNPHTGQSRYVWQFDSTNREALCRTCHPK